MCLTSCFVWWNSRFTVPTSAFELDRFSAKREAANVVGDGPRAANCRLIIGFQTGLVGGDRRRLAFTMPPVPRLSIDRMAAVRAIVAHEAITVSAAPPGIAFARTRARHADHLEQPLSRVRSVGAGQAGQPLGDLLPAQAAARASATARLKPLVVSARRRRSTSTFSRAPSA